MKSKLPAGLKDSNVEIFASGNSVEVLQNGSVKSLFQISDQARKLLWRDLMNHQPALNILMSWGYYGDDLLLKYAKCRFGGFDNIPDLDLVHNEVNPEYWNCPKRNACNGCGVVCILPQGPNGKLSPRELDALYAIKDGTPMKTASGKIGVRFNTLRSYLKSAYRKAGVHSNVELIQFARTNNII